VKLARAPGSREARWAHLLCGEVALPVALAPAPAAASGAADDVAALRQEVAELRGLVLHMARQLGIDPAGTNRDTATDTGHNP
jgi:uncharacterized protein YceH (UPF0502 family)